MRHWVQIIISIIMMAALAYSAIFLDDFLEEQASKRIAEEARELEIAREIRQRQCAAKWPMDVDKQESCLAGQ